MKGKSLSRLGRNPTLRRVVDGSVTISWLQGTGWSKRTYSLYHAPESTPIRRLRGSTLQTARRTRCPRRATHRNAHSDTTGTQTHKTGTHTYAHMRCVHCCMYATPRRRLRAGPGWVGLWAPCVSDRSSCCQLLAVPALLPCLPSVPPPLPETRPFITPIYASRVDDSALPPSHQASTTVASPSDT